MERVRLFEELSMNSWPAAVIQTVDGWRLRYTEGVSRRANSVWSNQPSGDTPLARRIDAAEAFYAARDAEACFHLSSAAHSTELDAVLAERGYYENGATCLQTARLADVLEATAPKRENGTGRRSDGPSHGEGDVQVEVSSFPSAEWERVAWPDPSLRPEVRRAIVGRIAATVGCALARWRGEPAAVGLAVSERGHMGVFCMRTEPRFRRRGLAEAVLRTLAAHGRARDARVAYLQVEENNPGAQQLYHRAGFETLYRYHYRSRALDG